MSSWTSTTDIRGSKVCSWDLISSFLLPADFHISVMRACNGCRKRKIKCDAATTNTWPCSACTRLKLVCVPPTIAQDGDFLATGQGLEQDPPSVGASRSVNTPSHGLPMQQNLGNNSSNQVGAIAPYNSALGIYSPYVPSTQNQHPIYSEVHPQLAVSHPYHQQPVFPTTPSQPLPNAESGVFLDDQSTAEDLSEALGELKIDETGIGECFKFNADFILLREMTLIISKHPILGSKEKA